MSRIATIKITIPGQLRDAWLYKNRIYLWNRQGQLLYLDADDAYRHILKNYGPGRALLAQILIFRNDWKVGEQFRLMMAVPEIDSAFSGPFSENNKVEVELPLGMFKLSNSEAYSGPVMDTCIFANRVYLATTNGLLESYLHPRFPDREYELNVQLDHRVSRLAIRYAAINASAEDKGLLFGRVIFPDSEDDAGFKKSRFRRLADYSLYASYASRNLLNYTGAPVPSFYRSKVEEIPAHASARFEDHQIVGYHEASDITGLTRATLAENETTTGRHHGRGDLTFEVLGNSNQALLAAVNDKLRVLSLQAPENHDISVRRNRAFMQVERARIDVSDVLDTYPISGGFIIELTDSIQLINRDGSYILSEGEAARIRTFASSLRYKEALAVVYEQSCCLIGFHTSKDVLF